MNPPFWQTKTFIFSAAAALICLLLLLLNRMVFTDPWGIEIEVMLLGTMLASLGVSTVKASKPPRT